ncbi:hypothetical protein K3N28_22400 [Glycomyces sp. TRM65418]|uniref:hypothetical protein n=1 Tax=Glycomyces sp. TRM65418 TaxID=2867006 RepID=UPI001CE577BC|nr:hypothetical protein [Glycomyces sp. TRM65418]MCC3765814.1 hypothetical protein [Glycomyces sp. TRM65418]QZD55400.1 hypothetical protein K3N28_22280 [Glycomyces sp. TRM65418]
MTYPPQPPEPNPYGAAPGGGPAGPPPNHGGPNPGQGDFAVEWGIKENPARPKKVNQLTQSLWAYFAATVLLALFAIIAVATVPWLGGFIIGSAIVGLIFHGLSIVIVWLITRDRLGAFGAADPRVPLYIGLGVLGLFSLGGFFGGWGLGWYAALAVLLGLARIAAVCAAFYLLTQPEVEQYLKSRPGNLPKPPQHPPHGYQQQPAPGQAPPPGYPQQPPAPGQAAPPSYPPQQ